MDDSNIQIEVPESVCSSLNNMLELPGSPAPFFRKQVRFSENIERIESSQSTIAEVSDCFGSDCFGTDKSSNSSSEHASIEALDSLDFSAQLLSQPKQLFNTPFLTITKNDLHYKRKSRRCCNNPDEMRCSKRKAWMIRLGLAIFSLALGYGLVYYVFFIANGRNK